MATLALGARVEVQGSGANRYTLEHRGEVYSCTCPAWRNQHAPIEQRTCKHLRAYLGDAEETARVGTVTAAPRIDRIRARRVTRFVDDREVRAERHAALERCIERHPVLDDRMQTVYGLRMPKHLARSMGFWNGLTASERKEAWAYLGNGPMGVGAWFLDDQPEQRVKAGLDERLDFRYRCDPPEMVSIFSGNSDGGHWGLWYDDPKELPTAIVMNYARDSAETWLCKPTLLDSLREQVAGDDDEGGFDPAEWPYRTAVLDWLDTVLVGELDAYEDQRPPWPGSRPMIIGGMGSIDRSGALPPELQGRAAEDARAEAYKQHSPVVAEWIALAKKELDQGSATRALFLGRELHWIDADEWRSDCTELLVRAYEKLDRHALAEIVKVHHAHRNLANVSVYESPPLSAFMTAVATNEVENVRLELAKHTPSAADLAQALGTTNLKILDLLLTLPGAPAPASTIARSHLDDLKDNADTASKYPHVRERNEQIAAAVLRIFELSGASGKAFEAALHADPTIRACAIAHADLAWESPRGRTVLHLAAAAPALDAVQRLVDRGADVLARDQDGKTAYDAARSAWERNMREVNAIMELLDARGGGPPKAVVEVVPDWAPGVVVAHKQFGEGVVESVAGIGDQTKLTIKFAAATKTLIAKFVTRV